MEKEIDLETAGRGGRERRCVAACTLVGSIICLLVAFPIGDTTATTSPSRCLESPPSNIGGRVFVGRVWNELEGRIEHQVFMAGLGCKPPPLSRQDTCSVLTAPDLWPSSCSCFQLSHYCCPNHLPGNLSLIDQRSAQQHS